MDHEPAGTHVHHESEHHAAEHAHHAGKKAGAMQYAEMAAVFVLTLAIVGALTAYVNIFIGAAIGAIIFAALAFWRRYEHATIAALAVIIVLTIAYRVSLLGFFGFYEPDGFYHFAVIRAAVMHGFAVPTYLSISGWPHSTLVSEPFGLYWVTLIPYLFLQFFGISYYDVMRLVPIAYALLDIIGVYFLMREFNKDKVFGILGMLFVGLSMGDAARTSATVYRGDGFVTIFVILALLFMIRTFKSVKKNDIYMYAGLTAFLLSLSNIVWNGASFGTAIYVLALVLIMLYAFLTEKLDILDKSRYLMLALLIWYVLVNIYNVLGWIGGQNEAFTGVYFIVLFLMLVAGNELARYLIKNRERFSIYVSTIGRRLMTFAAFTLAAVLFIYFLAPQIVYSIFVASGFQTNIAFAASIEELQAPTAQFLFASFGATLFMAPMNFIMYISTYYPQFVTSFWVLAMALIAMYFFMEFEGVDGSKFLGGRAVVRFKMNEALLVFVAYYAVTAYLQMHAVRFNSLLSIPLAIFTAYTMYWVLLWLKNFNKFSFFLGVILLVAIIGYIMYIDAGYTASLIQADNINPNFISAMGWVHNNTSPNSVFLTLWPDGSVVEGIGNRTSVTDSVGSQNKSKAGPFAAWLFNTTKDGQFLTSSINGRPDYLLVRYTWLLETSGIYTETVFNATSYNQSIITQLARGAFGVNSVAALNPQQLAQLNAAIPQLYAYNVFDSFAEHFNSSTESFTFTNTQQGFQAILVLQNLNNSQAINAYITSTSGGGKSPFKYVVLYNQDNANYQIFQQTAYAQTNNQTMVVQYSSVPKPGAYVNVTAAYMANIGLASSNMFKLIFLCGAQSCSWNNSVAHLQLAYINKDSKIFRIIYNSTAS